jgi:hypothetical protein
VRRLSSSRCSRPLLLVVIAVARLAFGRAAAQGAIVDELGGLIGGQTGAALEGMIASASLCQRAGRDGKGSTRVVAPRRQVSITSPREHALARGTRIGSKPEVT